MGMMAGEVPRPQGGKGMYIATASGLAVICHLPQPVLTKFEQHL